jgi:hypothetical protein
MWRCLLGAGLVLILTGCIERIDTSRPEHFVKECISAFSSGDHDQAWDLVSHRCQMSISEDYFREAVRIDGRYLGDLRIVDYSEVIQGASAVVTYEVNIPPEYGPVRQARWVRWSDGWRWDECTRENPRPRELW